MVISHSKKFLFVHNYKVGGTSMRRSLRRFDVKSWLKSPFADKWLMLTGKAPKVFSYNYPTHDTAAELKAKLPEDIFQDYYKFGFVRNPWDWQVSLYTFMVKNTKHYQHELIKSMKDFDEYIHWRIENEVRLQKRFFYDEQGNCLVDYIGKIEELEKGLEHVGKELGVSLKMHHLNASRDNNKYKKFYTQKTLDMVTKAYAEDIETFGYEVPTLD